MPGISGHSAGGFGAEFHAVQSQAQSGRQRVDLLAVFLGQESRRLAVRRGRQHGLAFDAGELCTRDPVFKTLGAQLLLELFFDQVPRTSMILNHNDNTSPPGAAQLQISRPAPLPDCPGILTTGWRIFRYRDPANRTSLTQNRGVKSS